MVSRARARAPASGSAYSLVGPPLAWAVQLVARLRRHRGRVRRRPARLGRSRCDAWEVDRGGRGRGWSPAAPGRRRSRVHAATRARRRSTTRRRAACTFFDARRSSSDVLFLTLIVFTGCRRPRDRRVPQREARASARLAAALLLVASRGLATGGPSAAGGRRVPLHSAAPRSTPPTARSCHGVDGAAKRTPGPASGVGTSPASARRCAASARWRPTSTCAPATCRSPSPATQPRRVARRLLASASSARSSPTSPRSAPGPAIPQPAPGARQPVATGCTLFTEHCAGCHQIAAAGRLRHRRASRRRSADATADADRRGGAHRPVPDAALLDSAPISTAQLDSIIALRRSTRTHPTTAAAGRSATSARCPRGSSPGSSRASSLVAVCLVDRQEARA